MVGAGVERLPEPFSTGSGALHPGLGRRKREGGAFGREADLEMGAVAERLVGGLPAATERYGGAAHQIVTVAGLVDQMMSSPSTLRGPSLRGVILMSAIAPPPKTLRF